jgi:hypothetical protein
MIHGTVLSILFALRTTLTSFKFSLFWKALAYLAISIAPADHGFVKRSDGFGAAGLPGCNVDGDGWRREGERRGEEKDRRYSAMKKASFIAQNIKSTFCEVISHRQSLQASLTNIIRIVLFQNPTSAFINLLVTRPRAAHRQCCKHMHVVACQVQTDEPLEDNAPSWKRRCEVYE